ncbi:MAG: ABC transporter substrate-binding protein [Chloroflexota bacterium]
MKLNLRWQILLAVIALGLVFALLSFEAQTTGLWQAPGLCSMPVPTTGGTFVEGVLGAPQTLNPLLADTYPVDQELNSLIYDGLTRYGDNGLLEAALAESWSVSEDGLTVTFRLRPDGVWHDGEPVTAVDVVFTYGLLQAEDYPGPAAVGELWQSVNIQQIDDLTVAFTLPEPYAPFLDATTRGILPAHLLDGETAVSLQTSAFNKAPVGTGPFMVDESVDWQENGRLRLLPNPNTWPQGVNIAALEFQFFPDEESLLNAFQNNTIHAINRVSDSALPLLAAQPEARLFTAPDNRYTILLFNLDQPPSGLPANPSGRQALVYALDRPAVIGEALNGQGIPLEGPYLPTSWAYNPGLLTPYNYDGAAAAAALDAAGWLLPEGGSVRQKDGAPLLINLLTLDTPANRSLATVIGEQWNRAGVNAQITLAANVAELRQQLAVGAFDAALVEFAPPGDPDLYDFWSQEAVVRGSNYAAWNNRKASEALEFGRQTWPVEERRPFYDTFQRFYNQDLPALTVFQHVYTYALSPEVNEAEIGLITQPRDRYQTLAQWFLLYRDVMVVCPDKTDGSDG